MNTIFYEKKSISGFRNSLFLIGFLAIICLSCSSADNNYYRGGQTSRSFTEGEFNYEQLKIEGIFHVVNPDQPSCSFTLEFLSNSTISIQNQVYQYTIGGGQIHIVDPDQPSKILVSFQVHSENAANPDYVSVVHTFKGSDAAKESNQWIGNAPDQYEAKWYRARMKVGASPYDIVLCTTDNGDFLYVANSSGGTVSVIRTLDNKIVGTIPVGNAPNRLAVAPDGSHVYVTNAESLTVSVIQTSNNSVIRTIPVGKGPNGVACTPDGSYVFVANANEESISVIQTSDHSILGTIPMGADTLTYVEVLFSSNNVGSDYALLAIESDCRTLNQKPDMDSPLCQENSVNGECPTKCPSSMGQIGLVFNSVKPDANGYWRSEFISGIFRGRAYTFLLVENFTKSQGFDLDLDDNGIFDYKEQPEINPPWKNIVDEVGIDDAAYKSELYTDVTLPAISDMGAYYPGGYSRIPDGKDTDSKDDWVRNNDYSCWLHPTFDDSNIIHLSDIPEHGKAYNTPGESNFVSGGETIPQQPVDHPVINEFFTSHKDFQPIGVAMPSVFSEGEDGYLFVSTKNNILLKIRISDYMVLEKINTGDGRVDMAILPNGDVYVANVLSFSLSVIRNGVVFKKIPIGFAAMDIALSSDGKYAFVTDSRNGRVTVIRTSDHSMVEWIPLDGGSFGVAAPQEGNYIYVTSEDQNTVSIATYNDPSGCN